MNLQMTGIITEKLKVESGVSKATQKEWKKQTFVIDNGSEYNPLVAFSCFGEEKVDNLKQFKKGASVTVSFNINSREYEGKYYTNVDAWKVEETKDADEPAVDAEEVSDLPF